MTIYKSFKHQVQYGDGTWSREYDTYYVPVELPSPDELADFIAQFWAVEDTPEAISTAVLTMIEKKFEEAR